MTGADVLALVEAYALAREALTGVCFGECESFIGTSYCRSEGSGRTKGAEFLADAWCQTCIARDALARLDALVALPEKEKQK